MTRRILRSLSLLPGAAVAAAGLATLHLRLVAPLIHGEPSFNDFKHLWLGARLLHLGQSPYDEQALFALAAQHGLGGINPYVYLPFTGLVLTPLSHLPFGAAARLWLSLSAGTLALALMLLCLHLARRGRLGLGLAVLGAAAAWASQMMPVHRDLSAGQINGPLALASVAILIGLERRWLWLAGLAIAFGAMFKLSPGLFVLWLLWKRAWRPLAWTALFSALFALWSLALAGWETHREFLPLLGQMRIGHSTWAHHGMAFHVDPANQAIGSFLSHIFAGASETKPWMALGQGVANALTFGAVLVVLGALAVATRRAWGPDGPPTDVLRAEWTLVVAGSLLLPSLMWDHYSVQLIPVILAGIWSTAESPSMSTRARGVATVLWVSWALLLTVWVLHWGEGMRSGWGLLAMSIRLWGVLGVFCLGLWWRWKAAEAPREAENVPPEIR